jgi:hypothetical protein
VLGDGAVMITLVFEVLDTACIDCEIQSARPRLQLIASEKGTCKWWSSEVQNGPTSKGVLTVHIIRDRPRVRLCSESTQCMKI